MNPVENLKDDEGFRSFDNLSRTIAVEGKKEEGRGRWEGVEDHVG